MTGLLLDTPLLAGYLSGRSPVTAFVDWHLSRVPVRTSLLCYAEVAEALQGRANADRHRAELRLALQTVRPLSLSFRVLDGYGAVRRARRPPYGPGLIGDIDTLIASTALAYDFTLVTTDGDFLRVPDLKLILLDRKSFEVIEQPA